MSKTLRDVMAVVERLWPVSGASDWDAPGLVTGDPDAPVRRIHLALDAVSATVAEAVDAGSDLLLTHHPLILRPVHSVAEDRYKGALLARLIRANCGLMTVHTNADVVRNGVSDRIATLLGLENAQPIQPHADASIGIGRVGLLPEPITLGALARRLGTILPATAAGIRVAGDYNQPVRNISLCGGAGDSLLGEPAVQESDVYITSDLRHHPASEAREQALLAGTGPALIDVSHWASEWLWLDTAAQQLRGELDRVEVAVSDLRTDPWDFVIVQ
ncbi:MAG: Nif3-like dinuclear metal center hexameric protein [Microbacteriaceae bacterium]